MVWRKVLTGVLTSVVVALLTVPPAAARESQKVLATKHKHAPARSGEVLASPKKLAVAAKKSSPRYTNVHLDFQDDGERQPGLLQGRISSRSAVVMDAETGDVLYSHNPDLPGQPASTIKVLTGFIAMKSLPNSELVPASKRAAQMPRSKIYLKPGKKYVADDLINAVLMASANDASVALAEKIAGSERAFAKLMTRKAEALGARNTVCKTANGLTAPGQQSTAYDLAAIFRQAMQDDEFSRRMAFTAVKTRDGKLLRTHNKALWQIEGAEGGKTGYTHAARKTYVGKFRRGTHEIIVALMGSESMWEDIRHLVEFGFRQKAGQELTVAANGLRYKTGDSLTGHSLPVLEDASKLSRL